MSARNTNGFWHVASIALGIVCIPFIAIWFWHNLAVVHEPLHPVLPDHVIPMDVGRHAHVIVYVTPLQNEFWSLKVLFSGALVWLGFFVALTMATRGRIYVLANVQLIATKDGGRAEPVTTGYTASSSFASSNSGGKAPRVTYAGRFQLNQDQWLYPGSSAEVIVSFRNGNEAANVIQPGRRWAIHEHGRLIGHGEVITLLTMATFDAARGR